MILIPGPVCAAPHAFKCRGGGSSAATHGRRRIRNGFSRARAGGHAGAAHGAGGARGHALKALLECLNDLPRDTLWTLSNAAGTY